MICGSTAAPSTDSGCWSRRTCASSSGWRGRGPNWRQPSPKSDGWMLTQRGDDLATWLKWMKSLLPAPTTAQRLKRLASLLATPAALLLSGGRAEAILTCNISESGSDVVVQTSGSLNLPSRISESGCGSDGYVFSSQAIVCTGPSTPTNVYTISGPNSFNSTASISGANSFSGITTGLFGFMS